MKPYHLFAGLPRRGALCRRDEDPGAVPGEPRPARRADDPGGLGGAGPLGRCMQEGRFRGPHVRTKLHDRRREVEEIVNHVSSSWAKDKSHPGDYDVAQEAEQLKAERLQILRRGEVPAEATNPRRRERPLTDPEYARRESTDAWKLLLQKAFSTIYPCPSKSSPRTGQWGRCSGFLGQGGAVTASAGTVR